MQKEPRWSPPRDRPPLSFNAFVMNTPSHIVHGTWRKPGNEHINFNQLDHWVSLANILEDGGFDAMFFADVLGLQGNHGGGWQFHAEHGVQIPANDPLVLISALTATTRTLCFVVSAAMIGEPPFVFARRISTLDHLSNGRLGWNVVTSSLANAYRNLGWSDLLDHDARYDLAAEHIDVLYKLWEGSWEDDAIVADTAGGRWADPDRIHKIHHVGPHYRVEGPHLSSPSPQRTPVIFQAGASPAGARFAARHAEIQLIQSTDPERARELIDHTRSMVRAAGRSPADLAFVQALSFVVGSTEREARDRADELDEWIDTEAMVAHLGGAMGVDLAGFTATSVIDPDTIPGVTSIIRWAAESTGDRRVTVADLARFNSHRNRIVGTPDSISAEISRWADAGVSGINVIFSEIPGSYRDFIDHVLPVLRQRGLARISDRPQTLRHRLFGRDRLPDSHPAAAYRGAL
ncbi:MAG: NtaA/DmoA family FMN-dependent monooxygenase [Gordonia sp. (in: high G+C Gram-positive bacteria)]